jgi:hypothetical protein
MSLVTSAAPVNYDNDNNDNNDNIVNVNKVVKKNQTYKNKENRPKMNKEMIENTFIDSDDEDTNLGDFKPVQTTMHNKEIESINYDSSENNDAPVKSPNEFNNLNSNHATDYYKQYTIPNEMNQNINSNEFQGSYQVPLPSIDHNTELLKKLDNILHLLEEQQEEKAHFITEELILYIFLGVFIIYVLDSFVRVGKYVR